MLKNLLIYRLVLLNLVIFIGFIAAWSQGLVQYVFSNDHSHVSYLIALLYVLGLIGVFNRALKVSKALNFVKDGNIITGKFMNEVYKFKVKSAWIGTIMNSLTGIGLVGTVIGLGMMFAGIDPNGGSTDVLQGASVAFMCTLLGIGTTVLTEWNYRMLMTATELLESDMIR